MHPCNPNTLTERWETGEPPPPKKKNTLGLSAWRTTKERVSNEVEGEDRHRGLSPDHTCAMVHVHPSTLTHGSILTTCEHTQRLEGGGGGGTIAVKEDGRKCKGPAAWRAWDRLVQDGGGRAGMLEGQRVPTGSLRIPLADMDSRLCAG